LIIGNLINVIYAFALNTSLSNIVKSAIYFSLLTNCKNASIIPLLCRALLLCLIQKYLRLEKYK